MAQTQALPGPYSSYNANQYPGPIYYNPGYAQYGLPGVGVSPWNPIVQAQLNLGMRTARYNMYSAWADQSNAAANLYYQQAVAQQLQNQHQLQTMQVRYDVQTRAPRPVSSVNPEAKKLLAKGDVLKANGEVAWPSSDTGKRDARQVAKRGGSRHPGGRQGVRGRRQGFDSERGRSQEPAPRLRQTGPRATRSAPTETKRTSCSSFSPAWSKCSTAWRVNE